MLIFLLVLGKLHDTRTIFWNVVAYIFGEGFHRLLFEIECNNFGQKSQCNIFCLNYGAKIYIMALVAQCIL